MNDIQGVNLSDVGRKMTKVNRHRAFKRKVKKFFAIVFSMTLCFLFISVATIFAYMKLILSPEEQSNVVSLMSDSISNAAKENFAGFVRKRITVLLIGVDKEGSRTDVIMLATWNKETNQVDLISVPRDTRITLPNSLARKLKNSGANYLPTDNKMKINAINAYAYNVKDSITIVRDFLEDMLNVNIDYYAKIDTTAFAEAIDVVGGVDFDVPDDLYYSDPTQNLLIDLKRGKQHLNGKQSEGLVRFRGYFYGDLQRIKVQQDFLKSAFAQIKEKMTLDKMTSMAFKLYKYVETDFKVTAIPEAIEAIANLNDTAIYSHTIPGTTQYINTDGYNVSYFIHDVSGTEELIDSIWYPEAVEDENAAAKEAIKWDEY